MLEVPKSRWERVAPFVAGGVLLAVLVGAGVMAVEPKLILGERAAAADTGVVPKGAKVAMPVESADTALQNTWIEWRADQPLSHYRVGGFTFTFRPVVADGLNAARMRVESTDGLSTEITGQGLSWSARAKFAVVQLDATKTDRQVLFSSFSGGAHCCTSMTLLEVKGGVWRATDLGAAGRRHPGSAAGSGWGRRE